MLTVFIEMSELLFECYRVPSVSYGLDSIFSYYYNTKALPLQDTLILSSGNKSTYYLPILSGRSHGPSIKRYTPVLLCLTEASLCVSRIPLGGAHCTQLMQDLFHLKYPFHRSTITTGKAEVSRFQTQFGRTVG